MDIYCKVTQYGLVPLYNTDLELKKHLKIGNVVKCKVSNPRNYEHHKKFFALVRLTFDNLPLPLVEKWHIHNEQDMLRRFKRDLGYFTNTLNEYGEHEIEYLSYRLPPWNNTNLRGSITNALTLFSISTSKELTKMI